MVGFYVAMHEVLAHELGSLTSNTNIFQTRRPLGAWHIPQETNRWEESNDEDFQGKFSDILLQKPSTSSGYDYCPTKP